MIGIKTADGKNSLSASKKRKKKMSAGNVKRGHEAKATKLVRFKPPVYTKLSPYSHPSSYLKVVVRIRNGTDTTPACLHTDLRRVKQEDQLADTKLTRSATKRRKGTSPNLISDSVSSTCSEGELARKEHLMAVWPFRDIQGNEFSKIKKRKRHVTR